MNAGANRTIQRLLSALLCLMLMFAAPLSFAQEEDEAESDSQAEEAEAEAEMADPESKTNRWGISGRFDIRFDGRWSDNEYDIDADQFLRINIDPVDHPNIHFRSSLWLIENLGESDDDDPALVGLSGAYDSDVLIRPLHIHLDIDDLWGDSVLRIGRQRIFEGPILNRLDGVYFSKRTEKSKWYVFGGWRASYYEESHNDPSFGAGFTYRILPTTRIGVDAYYVDEERNNVREFRPWRWRHWFYSDYPRYGDKQYDDTLVAVSLWHDVTQNMRFFGRYTWHDETSDQLTLELSGLIEKLGVTYELSYQTLFDTAEERLNDQTFFYRVLGSYAAHQHFYLGLHKQISERVSMSLEAELHDADHDGLAEYNRDYSRIAWSTEIDNLIKEIDASLTLAYWNADDDGDSWVITGELRRGFGPVDVAVGMEYEHWVDVYQRYRPWPNRLNNAWIFFGGLNSLNRTNLFVRFFDIDEDDYVQEVYAIYGRADWQIDDSQNAFAEVSIEEDDGPDSPYFRVRAGYGVSF